MSGLLWKRICYREEENARVTIPAGIDNGQSVRCAGGGEPGVNGGERGDLLVEAVVSQHPVFKRQDTSIFSTVPISFATAALGGPIRIRTVDGEVELRGEAGTQTDTRVPPERKRRSILRNRNVRGDRCVTNSGRSGTGAGSTKSRRKPCAGLMRL